MTAPSRLFVRSALAALALVGALLLPAAPAQAQSRIKDIVDIEGVRDNMLVGYGLVVGLNGTGDSLKNSPFTEQSLTSMLERLGVNTRGDELKTKNVAAVMVTAVLPPFSTQGARIDVNVSALGDAKSLLGGMLLVTPLMGADGEVYAVAQGSLAVGGFTAGGDAETVSKGVPTQARISSGALIEREVEFDLAALQTVRMTLRNPDFTTASRIVEAIDRRFGPGSATALNPGQVQLNAPAGYGNDPIRLVTEVEQLLVSPDQVAKVVIDESSGVIVMGEAVRISTVAIAQGNLTIRITETPQVSQPNALGEGETVVVPRTGIDVDEDEGRQLAILQNSVSLQELVAGLNALGVGPRDMISILQAIKAAGALQAEIEVI